MCVCPPIRIINKYRYPWHVERDAWACECVVGIRYSAAQIRQHGSFVNIRLHFSFNIVAGIFTKVNPQIAHIWAEQKSFCECECRHRLATMYWPGAHGHKRECTRRTSCVLSAILTTYIYTHSLACTEDTLPRLATANVTPHLIVIPSSTAASRHRR